MTKRSTPRAPAEVSLSMDIEDYLTHYAFGERFPRDRPGPPVTESLMLNLWGTVVSPKEKSGRDMQTTIDSSEHLGAVEGRPVIGELFWGSFRAARVYVPPSAIWPLAQAIGAGHLKLLQFIVDAPLRGNTPIRKLHLLTRDLVIAGENEADET